VKTEFEKPDSSSGKNTSQLRQVKKAMKKRA
jgi:hypothetical protein